MKRNTLLATLGLLLIQPAIAAKPERCPDVVAIAAVGVDKVGEGRYQWMAFPASPNNYNTNQAWSFGIFVRASSETEAIKTARANIGLLVLSQGPFHDDDDKADFWTCEYGGPGDIIAYAFTPPNFVAFRDFAWK